MEIREAKHSDLTRVTEIYNREVAEATTTFDTEPRDRGAAERWFDVHRSERYPLLVAVDDGEVIGWAALSPWSERGAYRHTAEGSVFVCADSRGTGVGTVLTHEIVERARAAGHHVLVARIESQNAHSRALLLANGFRLIGTMREVGRKFERWLDVEVYELILDGK